MDSVTKQNLFAHAQYLASAGHLKEAISLLLHVDCVMGNWLKGKFYLLSAERIAESFAFKYYPTDYLKAEYLGFLNEAHNHLYKAGLLLPAANYEVQVQLNQQLWHCIAKVENCLASFNTVVETKEDDFYEEDVQQSTDDLVDQINDWML